MSNIAFLDKSPKYWVSEDGGDYDATADDDHLRKAEGQIDKALNLVGLLLATLEYDADERATQVHTAVKVIEQNLQEALNLLDRR